MSKMDAAAEAVVLAVGVVVLLISIPIFIVGMLSFFGLL